MNGSHAWKSLKNVKKLPVGEYLVAFNDSETNRIVHHVVRIINAGTGSSEHVLRLIGSHFIWDVKHLRPIRYMDIPE